jgi:hypothetical protein
MLLKPQTQPHVTKKTYSESPRVGGRPCIGLRSTKTEERFPAARAGERVKKSWTTSLGPWHTAATSGTGRWQAGSFQCASHASCLILQEYVQKRGCIDGSGSLAA